MRAMSGFRRHSRSSPLPDGYDGGHRPNRVQRAKDARTFKVHLDDGLTAVPCGLASPDNINSGFIKARKVSQVPAEVTCERCRASEPFANAAGASVPIPRTGPVVPKGTKPEDVLVTLVGLHGLADCGFSPDCAPRDLVVRAAQIWTLHQYGPNPAVYRVTVAMLPRDDGRSPDPLTFGFKGSDQTAETRRILRRFKPRAVIEARPPMTY